MASLKFSGIFASLATPFDHEGNLYAAKVRHNVGKWNQVNLAGYVVGAAAGEGAYLTADEKVELWSLAAESTAPGRLLIAGCSAESVRETVSLANKAAAAGYSAVLVEAPRHYRNVVTDDSFFPAVADGSRIPVLAATAGSVSHPNIAAVAGGSAAIQGSTKPVLCGAEESLWDSLRAGASGAVLGFASAAPYACILIWEAFRTREEEAGRDWQNRIRPAAELVTSKYGIPGLKHAMDLNGYHGGPCRLPLRPLAPGAKREIAAAFENLRG